MATPPPAIGQHDPDAERAVLGAILLDLGALEVVTADGTKPAHFHLEAHRLIFAASIELQLAGKPCDLVTVTNHLREGGMLEGVGGGLIAVAAPAAISAWFVPWERGLPMGIWTTWVPIGNVLMFNAAHPLLESFGWQASARW